MEEGKWGEHEIDHVLICVPDMDVVLAPEPNEVATAKYFTEEELQEFLLTAKDKGVKVSPWFDKIQAKFLAGWWQAVREGRVAELEGRDMNIHRL